VWTQTAIVKSSSQTSRTPKRGLPRIRRFRGSGLRRCQLHAVIERRRYRSPTSRGNPGQLPMPTKPSSPARHNHCTSNTITAQQSKHETASDHEVSLQRHRQYSHNVSDTHHL